MRGMIQPAAQASPGARFAREAAAFRTDGYTVLPRLFAPADLAPVDACIGELTRQALSLPDLGGILELEPGSAPPVPRRIFDPFARHQSFRALATDARLLDA